MKKILPILLVCFTYISLHAQDTLKIISERDFRIPLITDVVKDDFYRDGDTVIAYTPVIYPSYILDEDANRTQIKLFGLICEEIFTIFSDLTDIQSSESMIYIQDVPGRFSENDYNINRFYGFTDESEISSLLGDIKLGEAEYVRTTLKYIVSRQYDTSHIRGKEEIVEKVVLTAIDLPEYYIAPYFTSH